MDFLSEHCRFNLVSSRQESGQAKKGNENLRPSVSALDHAWSRAGLGNGLLDGYFWKMVFALPATASLQ